MIWESTLRITLVDLVILSVASTSLWLLFQQIHKLLQVKAVVEESFTFVGLTAIGLFYAVDSFTMFIMPLYTTKEYAMASMKDLPLNLQLVGRPFFNPIRVCRVF